MSMRCRAIKTAEPVFWKSSSFRMLPSAVIGHTYVGSGASQKSLRQRQGASIKAAARKNAPIGSTPSPGLDSSDK